MVKSIIVNKAKLTLGATLNIRSRARDLRKKMTAPEIILWTHLRKRKLQGLYFRRQHPYGIYILDFYCFEVNLAIEIDGMIHLNHQAYDNERTKYLESSGVSVIRFNNNDIETRIEWVLEKINSFITNLPPQNTTNHFPQGEIRKGVEINRKEDFCLYIEITFKTYNQNLFI